MRHNGNAINIKTHQSRNNSYEKLQSNHYRNNSNGSISKILSRSKTSSSVSSISTITDSYLSSKLPITTKIPGLNPVEELSKKSLSQKQSNFFYCF